MSYPNTTFETQSELQFDRPQPVRAYSPDDLQKLKYKIDLGKRFLDYFSFSLSLSFPHHCYCYCCC